MGSKGIKKVVIHGDSELVVYSVTGRRKLHVNELIKLREACVQLKPHFETLDVRHVRREFNQEADALSKEMKDAARATAESYGSL